MRHTLFNKAHPICALTASASLLLSCTLHQGQKSEEYSPDPIVKHGDELAIKHGLRPLREKKLKRSQTEIRIWQSGMFISGRILQFEGDRGRMIQISEWVDEGLAQPLPAYKMWHPARACDWPSLLARLTEYGIFTLPGQGEVSSQSSTENGINLDYVQVDGSSYTFEVATGTSYRSYRWSNMKESDRWPHLNPYVPRVVSILNALKLEFGMGGPHTLERLPEPLRLNQVLLVRSAYTMGAVKITEFEFEKSENHLRGHISYEWQTVRLNDDFTISNLAPNSGTRSENWEQSVTGMPELSLQFFGFDVQLWARENQTFLVSYPDPDSLEIGEVTRHAYAMTEYTEFDEIDYLSDEHEFTSAYVDYEPPCLSDE